MMAPLKIVYVYPEGIPSDKARTTTVVHSCQNLAEVAEVTLVVASGGDKKEIKKSYGVDLEKVRIEKISRRWLGFLLNDAFNLRLGRFLKKNQPDVVYVRNVKTADWILKSRGRKFKVVYEAHELAHMTAPTPAKARRLKKMEAWIFARADGVVAISDSLGAQIKEIFGTVGVSVLPLGVKVPAKEPQKDFSAIEEVYYAGSIGEWKGVDYLIQALAYCKRKFSCVIIARGSREQKERLLNLAKKCGVVERIQWRGAMPHAELMGELAERAKLCVLPNADGVWARFTSPLKFFEYAATGNVIVYSQIPALQKLIGGQKVGVGVPPSDAVALAAALDEVCAAPQKFAECATGAYRFACENSWENRAAQIVRLAENLHAWAMLGWVGSCAFNVFPL